MKVLTDGTVAVGLQAVGALLTFLVQLTFARYLGPSEYGLFAYYFALAALVGVWSRLGSDLVVQRIGGQAMASGRLDEMRSVLRHSQVVTIAGGIVGAIVVGAWAVGTGLAAPRLWLPALTSLLVVTIGIAGVRQAALLALGRSIAALGPDLLLKPVVVLTAMGIAMWSGLGVSAEFALGIIVVGGAFAIVVAGQLIARATAGATASEDSNVKVPGWTKLGLALMFAHASYMLFYQSDTLVLGYVLGPESIGTYQVAKQISQVGLFAMISIQHVFAAHMSALVSNHDWQQVRSLYFGIVRIGAGFAGTVLLVFWIVGTFLIEVFGPDYSDAYTTTLIMLSFQLILAVLGPIGMFAVMSGRQRVIWIAYATAAVLVISGMPLAAKQWGINGAAMMHGFISVLCAAVLCTSIWRSVPSGSAANSDGSVRRG